MRAPQSEKASSMPTCPTHFGQPCDLPFRTYDPARGSECAAPPPGESRQPPLVAHCIAGQARTFIEPAVYQSITTNLLPAFGGRTATLLYLKTWSSTAKSASNEFTSELRKDQLVWLGTCYAGEAAPCAAAHSPAALAPASFAWRRERDPQPALHRQAVHGRWHLCVSHPLWRRTPPRADCE